MDYVNRGSTGTKVSRIFLVEMTYGSKQWRDVEAGGRFPEFEIN
jgi:aryl-alcohol dehydrogenase-like predicted oxidoreductase